MTSPYDQQLFLLTSEIVREGLGFVERTIDSGRSVKPYESWPTLASGQSRVPEFSFSEMAAPSNYKDLFNPIWHALFRVMAREGTTEPEEFEFEGRTSFQKLAEYIHSQHVVRERFGWTDHDEEWFRWSVKYFVENLIDRYIHVFGGTSFEITKFISVYLPFENGVIVDRLPIRISVPILLISFP